MFMSIASLHKLTTKDGAGMREKKDLNIEIGRRVKLARENAGLTQERFAELVDLGPKNISAIERGAAGVSVASVKKICEVLSISADSLFSDRTDSSGEVQMIADRLNRLSPKQLAIAVKTINILFEAFAMQGDKGALKEVEERGS